MKTENTPTSFTDTNQPSQQALDNLLRRLKKRNHNTKGAFGGKARHNRRG